MADILDIIFSRRSIRKYQDKAVEKETMVKLLKAAMAAPTACNNQPWEFIAITDKSMMDNLRQSHPHGKYNAPAAFIVCRNPEVEKAPQCNQYWVQDCTAALENILIAAAGLGLGTVWLGVHPNEEREQILRDNFGIPTEVTPMAVVYVGYPAEVKEAGTKYEEKRVHWQKYG